MIYLGRGNGSGEKAVRYSLEELMTSYQTDLGKFKERVQTQTKFWCEPNNFLVLDDQRIVIGVNNQYSRIGFFSSKGMNELKYSLLQMN